MIPRPEYLEAVRTALGRSPVTALLGPRQCGKTTLARMIPSSVTFDLESLPDRRRLQNPEMVLGSIDGTVVIDEIQRMPALFEVLRVLVDRSGNRGRFLILGSASPDIVRGASETLAGRIEFIELAGFDISELDGEDVDRLWLRGGFPRSFLADSDQDSTAWREGFIRTFLERDIAELGFALPSAAMRRFWTMLAHQHGQTWNGSQIGRSMGLSDKTVRGYLDVLTGTFMVRQLQPWHENIGKRQVKAPKIYIRDSGILHALLGLERREDLLSHPKVGASWEGFAIEQLLRNVGHAQAWFWATHGGAELDLLIQHRGKRYGFEIKFNEAPASSKSMRVALDDLGLEHLWVVFPGKTGYPIDHSISVVPLTEVPRLLTG
jgi:predicted AAA+ superfamily ATPase